MKTLDGSKIKALREAKGMTMEAAAQAAGLGSRQQWYGVESGTKKDPRTSTAARIASVLGVTVDALLTQ